MGKNKLRKLKRKRLESNNPYVAEKVGGFVQAPCITSLKKAMTVVNLHQESQAMVMKYVLQMDACLRIHLSAIRRSVVNHIQDAIKYHDSLVRLRESHIAYLVYSYSHMMQPSLEGADKGWSRASALFMLILLESKLLNAYRFVCRYLACLHDLDPNEAPHNLYDVKLSAKKIRKIPSPKLFCLHEYVNERATIQFPQAIPTSLQFSCDTHAWSINNNLLIFPGTPFSHMTLFMLYTSWFALNNSACEQRHDIEDGFSEHMRALLDCTAELALETWHKDEDVLDMGDGYMCTAKSGSNQGNSTQGAIRVMTNNSKKEEKTKKEEAEESVAACNYRVAGEICAMFVDTLSRKHLYLRYLKPKQGVDVKEMCAEWMRNIDSNNSDSDVRDLFVGDGEDSNDIESDDSDSDVECEEHENSRDSADDEGGPSDESTDITSIPERMTDSVVDVIGEEQYSKAEDMEILRDEEDQVRMDVLDNNDANVGCESFAKFCTAVEQWLLETMDMSNDPNYKDNVVMMMRNHMVGDAAYEKYMFARLLIAPRDVLAFEEVWYGTNKMMSITKNWGEMDLREFNCNTMPSICRHIVVLTAFSLNVCINDRSLSWIDECVWLRRDEQRKLVTLLLPASPPAIFVFGKSVFVSLDRVYYVDNCFEAVAAWMLYVATKCNYSIMVNDKTVKMHWLKDIITHLVSRHNIPELMKKFSRARDPVLEAVYSQFEELALKNNTIESVEF